MYVIAGATGNVGSVAADKLLAAKKPVRVIVRDQAKGQPFVDKGAEVAVGTLDDEAFLAKAFEGATGAFVLLPPNTTVADFPAYQRQIADAVCAAVEKASVPHVVLLSSIGADQESGLGPINGLHYFEEQLKKSGAKLTALRPGSFQENVAMSLGPAKAQGIYPSFLPPEFAMPMIATRDIGAEAARALLEPAAESQVIDIVGPPYSGADVAKLLGERLGKTLKVVTIPPEGWRDAFLQAGMPEHFADLYTEMYTGMTQGLAKPVGDRLVQGKTTLDAVVAELG